MEKEKINKYFVDLVKEIIYQYQDIFSYLLLSENGDKFSDSDYYSYVEEIEEYFGINIDYGASKLVIISKENNDFAQNYVLKIPFNRNTDFCYIEMSNYIYVSNHYEEYKKYFAECWLADELFIQKGSEVRELPLYIMQRADTDEGLVMTLSNDYWSSKNLSNRTIELDESTEVMDCFCEVYGEEEIQKLQEILEEVYADDIHSRNVGFIKGLPVLIDYSGFW